MRKYGRPPKGATEVLALKTKNKKRYWIDDDGKNHVGFSYKASDGFPFALYFTNDESIGDMINDKTAERFGCSNGRNGLYS